MPRRTQTPASGKSRTAALAASRFHSRPSGSGTGSATPSVATTWKLTGPAYLCGPKPFLRAFVDGLARAGVPADRIHYDTPGVIY